MAVGTWSAAEKFRNNINMKIKTILTLVAALAIGTASSADSIGKRYHGGYSGL